MRRNVRRLNREIGNHGSSLPVSTQVSLPLTLPTSYQPRSQEKKIISNMKSTVQMAPEMEANPMDMSSYSMGQMATMPIVDSSGAMSMAMPPSNSDHMMSYSPQQVDNMPTTERKLFL